MVDGKCNTRKEIPSAAVTLSCSAISLYYLGPVIGQVVCIYNTHSGLLHGQTVEKIKLEMSASMLQMSVGMMS